MPNVEAGGIGSNGQVIPALLGNKYVPIILNAAAGTTPQLMITGAPGYYVSRLFVEVDASCTLAVGGMVSINFTDTGSGLIIGQYRAYIPAAFAAPTVPTGPQLASSGTGYLFVATTSVSTCTVSISVALTAGTIRCAINAGTCNFIGTP